ncbi:MAG: hypothetical protein CMM07_28525 [Rhodopirellula sp.]|nr:hypothetical protein [Rhodopirellula sp.]
MRSILSSPLRQLSQIASWSKLVSSTALLFVILLSRFCSGDEFSTASPFYQKLATPMNSVIDGKPFRAAISGIAEQVGLNVWLDRSVDPTAVISVGSSGSTVYGALSQIAASRDCVLMPISNVLLVGRPERIAKLTAAILMPRPMSASVSTAVIDVTWDDLTTPTTALNRSTGKSFDSSRTLPHDLWPKTEWRQIEQNVAVALILGQFNLQFDQSLFPKRLVTSSLQPTRPLKRRYSSELAKVVRPTISKNDPTARIRVSGNWLETTATFSAHAAANEAIFAALKPTLPDPDKDTFTLKQMRTTAGNALQQLCGVAGRRCEIAPDARKACERTVTVEGKDATLRELIELVANQAGVKATWRDDVIFISP